LRESAACERFSPQRNEQPQTADELSVQQADQELLAEYDIHSARARFNRQEVVAAKWHGGGKQVVNNPDIA
jgi:hypothetical protein